MSAVEGDAVGDSGVDSANETVTDQPHWTWVTPRRVVYAICWLLILLGAVAVPMPFFAIAPGNAIDVASLIEIEGQEVTPLDGETALLAVTLRRPSIAELGLARLDGNSELVPLGRYLPPGEEDEDYFARQANVFDDAFGVSAAVALRAGGFDVQVRSSPMIVGVIPAGPSDGLLMNGDLVTSINGVAVSTAEDLVAQAGLLEAGDAAELNVDRGTTSIQVRVTAAQAARMARPGLGVMVDTSPRSVELPFEVNLVEGVSIGGPSAGLMFTLTVYDLVSPENLLAGRRVTGTGTMGIDGRVDRIGSIRQKVVAAIDGGFDVFLAPRSQAADARAAAGDRILVIGVDTFAQALEGLRETPAAN
ncbi:MAG: PDZ domain-containing protein [Glaciecola sp.]